ncbi:p24 complex component [Malassezia equina]|uniref:P24 complex component n=1 Tax=Malassezia equina TaxID=1381935 RepID=A0AAF0EDM1_9BASI|nr:p24 complex component [Malassezia equina]
MLWAKVLIGVLAVLVQLAWTHTIDLFPSTEYCFFEDMHIGDEMTLTYQVSGGGHLDIDTRIKDPEGEMLYENLKKDTGTYDFVADKDGRYTYCFSNAFSMLSDKVLSFNVHGVLYLTDEEGLIPAERELRELANNVQLFKDEQNYLSMRERVHRNTTESTNARIKWWSIVQTGIILFICAFQIFFVKRQFEVRRSI